jgi:hypothetical protein
LSLLMAVGAGIVKSGRAEFCLMVWFQRTPARRRVTTSSKSMSSTCRSVWPFVAMTPGKAAPLAGSRQRACTAGDVVTEGQPEDSFLAQRSAQLADGAKVQLISKISQQAHLVSR